MSEQTYTRIVQIVVLLLSVLGLIYAIPFTPASAEAAAKPENRYFANCATLAGIAKARCERHERMYEKCHAIRGEAHHECDSEFIKANPLDCAKLSGAAAGICRAELEAVAICEPKQGREFVRCERETLGARGIGDNDPRY